MASTQDLRDFAFGLTTNGHVWVVFLDTGLVKEMTMDEYIDRKVDGELERTLVRGNEVQAELESIRILSRMARLD